jgi:hypothetical protein
MDHSSKTRENDDDHYDEFDLPSSHPAALAMASQQRRQTSHRGWQGDEMELQHQLEHQGKSTDVITAVDLTQFQNTQVGIGYQAKHVVRQRMASMSTAPIAIHTPQPSKTTAVPKASATTNVPGKEDLLRNEGLRAFRKEIEKILSSPAL